MQPKDLYEIRNRQITKMRAEFCWCDCFRASSRTIEDFTMPCQISWRSMPRSKCDDMCIPGDVALHCLQVTGNLALRWVCWFGRVGPLENSHPAGSSFQIAGSKEAFQWHVPYRMSSHVKPPSGPSCLWWYVVIKSSNMFEIRRVWMMDDGGFLVDYFHMDMICVVHVDETCEFLWMHVPPILVSNWDWYSCRVTFSKGAVVFCTFLALAHQLSLIGLCLLLLGQIDRTFCSCMFGTLRCFASVELFEFQSRFDVLPDCFRLHGLNTIKLNWTHSSWSCIEDHWSACFVRWTWDLRLWTLLLAFSGYISKQRCGWEPLPGEPGWGNHGGTMGNPENPQVEIFLEKPAGI